jgi:hypothetical protein
MRFAFSLSLAAIGVSFLLPSDGYKAAFFLSCGLVAFMFIRESKPPVEEVRVPTDTNPDLDDTSYNHN